MNEATDREKLNMSSNEKRSLRTIWGEWVKPLAVILIICGSFRSAVADWNDVPTGSMKPTIVEGDRIFVNKLAYGLRVPFTSWWVAEFEGPGRGEVVVLFAPPDGVRMVKRVVGLPGDRVELRAGHLLINDEPAAYRPLDARIVADIPPELRGNHRFSHESIAGHGHPIMSTPRRPNRKDFGPIVVPPDHYFVMGDNRDNSRDSRWFGCVERTSIVGRATAVILSLDLKNHYLPRWQRFFRSLP